MKKYFSWFILALLVGLLAGCGSSRDSASTAGADDGFGADPQGTAYVGAGTCVDCHQTMSFSEEAVAGYLASKHVVHSSHINAGSDAYCLDCHDPIGDGGTLEQYIDAADVPAEGLAAVGCENCHGAGGRTLRRRSDPEQQSRLPGLRQVPQRRSAR